MKNFWAIPLLLPATALAQPRLGRVQAPVEYGNTVLYPENDRSAPVFAYVAASGYWMTVDGRRTELEHLSSRAGARALDPASGVMRTYHVERYRARDRSFTVELWQREVETGGECNEAFGGLTVRKAGQQTHLRVVGYDCPAGD